MFTCTTCVYLQLFLPPCNNLIYAAKFGWWISGFLWLISEFNFAHTANNRLKQSETFNLIRLKHPQVAPQVHNEVTANTSSQLLTCLHSWFCRYECVWPTVNYITDDLHLFILAGCINPWSSCYKSDFLPDVYWLCSSSNMSIEPKCIHSSQWNDFHWLHCSRFAGYTVLLTERIRVDSAEFSMSETGSKTPTTLKASDFQNKSTFIIFHSKSEKRTNPVSSSLFLVWSVFLHTHVLFLQMWITLSNLSGCAASWGLQLDVWESLG